MLLLLSACLVLCRAAAEVRPNIVIFLADDLGWNDVGFHGSNQIPTPNIDALAYSGIVLQNYYVTPICTPSRSALMTAKYPIHTGMQHSVIRGEEPRGLPLSEKILPQYLKELGYKTHLVGKWHLGHYKREYLPLNRGFDSHVGFWTGKIDLYDHTNMELNTWGFDFRRGFEVADDLFGQYATDIYTKEAIKVVNAHNKSEPLFLMVAHSAMHSGNPSEFLRAPDGVIERFSYINDTQRRKYAGMLTKLDESVGKVVESLGNKGLLENTIILFSSDNGGPAAGFNENAASNYPLKGVKNTLWEGGIRGAGLLWSPLIKQQSRVANQTFHLVDWLPTFYSAAGGNTSVFVDKNIDGIDLWEALSKDLPSQRTKTVHNIDDIWGIASITVDNWKIVKAYRGPLLVKGLPQGFDFTMSCAARIHRVHVTFTRSFSPPCWGPTYAASSGSNYNGSWDYWYGPGGREGTYDFDVVYKSKSAEAINKVAKMPSKDKITSIRDASTIKCDKSIPLTTCKPLLAPCLFDIRIDPCERRNMADEKPEILQALLSELERVNATAVPPNNQDMDTRADPKYWGRVFTNFGDFEPLRSPPVKCPG